MSDSTHETHSSENSYGTSEKTFALYSFGLLLCIALTLIPFFVVKQAAIADGTKLLVVFATAILQFFVQLICFLRLTSKNEQGKLNVYSFVFAVVVLVTVIGGSMWIMHNLNYNMMH